ncbi:hypothetical protein [Aquimarina rhabdastrellae]
MIIETTYEEPEITKRINELVGKPFSIWQKLKLKGVGSSRMIIVKASNMINKKLIENSDLNYANIELRPQGILTHIKQLHQTYTWCIPYYQLVYYKTEFFSLHAQGQYIQFKLKSYKENNVFIEKMKQMRIEVLGKNNSDFYDR